MEFLGKELKIVATRGVTALYGQIEMTMYIVEALKVLRKYPVDMLVFEMPDDNHFQIRIAGYDFVTGKLDETTIAFTTPSLHIETFWFKIDDQGDFYYGTFLLPSEY